MRILVFGDIHGSLPTVLHILKLVDKYRPETVVLLGDMLYHGPRNPIPEGYDPKAAAQALSPLAGRIIAVAGNCDSAVDRAVLPFPLASDFAWILADGMRIFVTHGDRHTPGNLPNLREGDVFLYGHTHIPQARMNGEIALCNPGSLTLPKEDHPPSFGMFEFGAFNVLTAEEDVYLRLECL